MRSSSRGPANHILPCVSELTTFASFQNNSHPLNYSIYTYVTPHMRNRARFGH